MKSPVGATLLAVLALSLSGCEYVRLLRPSVLKQLNPDVVRLGGGLRPGNVRRPAGQRARRLRAPLERVEQVSVSLTIIGCNLL
jgi:hypothetical protein